MYLVFDTETSNLPNADLAAHHPDQARIVQLACLLVDENFREVGVFSSLIKPSTDFKISDGARRAHGISTEDCLRSGIMISTALQLFNSWKSQADIIIGHNIQFDRQLIDIEEQILYGDVKGYENPEQREICTMQLFTPICKLPGKYGKYKWPKLQEAYKHCFGIEFNKAHDALADVCATASIYRWYLENMEVKEKQLISQ